MQALLKLSIQNQTPKFPKCYKTVEPLTGSIHGKHDFYKTIAHKNTTSLKNNHTSHNYVQTIPKCQIKFGNRSAVIEGFRASVHTIAGKCSAPSAVFKGNPSSPRFVQSLREKTSVNIFKTWRALISHNTKPPVDEWWWHHHRLSPQSLLMVWPLWFRPVQSHLVRWQIEELLRVSHRSASHSTWFVVCEPFLKVISIVYLLFIYLLV